MEPKYFNIDQVKEDIMGLWKESVITNLPQDGDVANQNLHRVDEQQDDSHKYTFQNH